MSWDFGLGCGEKKRTVRLACVNRVWPVKRGTDDRTISLRRRKGNRSRDWTVSTWDVLRVRLRCNETVVRERERERERERSLQVTRLVGIHEKKKKKKKKKRERERERESLGPISI